MKLSDIMSPERIDLSMRANSKKRALEQLSELMARDSELNSNSVFQALIERERIGSTGIGDAVAIPHGRLKGVTQATGAFAVLENPIDFDSIDQKPVNMIFVLVVPEDATEEHLQLLAQLAKIFSNADAKEKLLGAGTPENALKLFQEFNQNQAVA